MGKGKWFRESFRGRKVGSRERIRGEGKSKDGKTGAGRVSEGKREGNRVERVGRMIKKEIKGKWRDKWAGRVKEERGKE